MQILNSDVKAQMSTQQSTLSQSLISASNSVLGYAGANALLSYVDLEQNSKDVAVIHQKLQDILGNGAYLLEEVILQDFYRSKGIPLPQSASPLDFVRLVQEADRSS